MDEPSEPKVTDQKEGDRPLPEIPQNLFGDHNVFGERDPLDNPVWGDSLLSPYTFESYKRQFCGRKLNVLSLQHDIYGSMLGFRLYVDGIEVRKKGVICPFSLLAATYKNDFYYIHTCTCHSPECAGIWGGTTVVQRDGLVAWITDARELQSRFLFDLQQFRAEMFRSCAEAVRFLEGCEDGRLEMEYVTVVDLRKALDNAQGRIAKRELRPQQ